MSPMLSADRLIEVIEQRPNGQRRPIIVYWYCVDVPRQTYAENIKKLRGDARIVPMIPRRPDMFGAPNGLLSDLIELLNDNKGAFDGLTAGTPIDPLKLLILSRSRFTMPGGCSPVTMPGWFPGVGGLTVDLEIEDLTFSADGPLNCAEVDVPLMCSTLFELEKAMVSRIRVTENRNPASFKPFFDLVARPMETPVGLIRTWEESCVKVLEPTGFRPTVKDGRTLTSRLVGLYSRLSVGQLYGGGEALANALKWKASVRHGFVSVLFRPTQRHPSPAANFGINLITTIYSTYQYITAASHAGEYGRFPIGLLHSFSHSLISDLSYMAFELSRDVSG